jgi:hypothetical protein
MPFGIPGETYTSGQGGHIIPGGVANAVAYPVAEWRLRKTARLAEDITSATGGEHRVSILRGGQFTVNVPLNLTPGQSPEDRGFREGATGQVGMIVGGGVKWYVFLYIIENATNDVIRLTITGYAQGAIPDPVLLPA